MAKQLKGLTVAQVIEQLQKQDQKLICMVGDKNFIPFPLVIKKETFYKHPDSDDTLLKVDDDDQDRDFILSEFDRLDALVLYQDRGANH